MTSVKKTLLWFAGILVLALGFGWWIATRLEQVGAHDEFAQCLAEKQIIMYGAEWCPHCQNEKGAFGSSFRYIPYVECPDNPQACLEKGIKGYPTWIFPDGRRFEGEMGLDRLSKESECSLENN